MAALVLTDAHAFGVVAGIAERRRAARADHLRSAFVPLLLFFEALLQRLHELVPAAHGFDLLLLFFAEEFLGERLQPFFGDLRQQGAVDILQPLEDMAEHLVELVEIALVLHQRGAGEIIEIVDLQIDDVLVQRIHQRQIFLERHRNARGTKLVEKLKEHETGFRQWLLRPLSPRTCLSVKRFSFGRAPERRTGGHFGWAAIRKPGFRCVRYCGSVVQ